MDISAILTEWGVKYREGTATLADLRKKVMQKSETEALFPLRPTESTILEGARAQWTRVLQRFQKLWTPIGDVSIVPEIIQLYELKIDVQERPDDLENSWLGFLADSSLDRRQWPFVKWWLEGLLEKSDEDLEKYEIFGGVLGTITAGTATAAGASMNGIKKLINTAVTAGTCAPISMGAVPTTNDLDLVNYVEDFVDNIPNLLVKELDTLVMAPDRLKSFKRGMREKYNKNYEQAGSLITVMDTNLTITAPASHSGSTKIWTTPKTNRVLGVKKLKNSKIFEVEKVDRLVKAYTDFWKGVGFWHYGYLFTNDVELT